MDQQLAISGQQSENEFKLQFQFALVKCGSIRKNEGYGRKHYVAGFVQGRQIIHESRVPFKRAEEARIYANEVLERYRRMAQAALLAFVLNTGAVKEVSDVQPTN